MARREDGACGIEIGAEEIGLEIGIDDCQWLVCCIVDDDLLGCYGCPRDIWEKDVASGWIGIINTEDAGLDWDLDRRGVVKRNIILVVVDTDRCVRYS